MDGAASHQFDRHRDIGAAEDEHHGKVEPAGRQPAKNLETAHIRDALLEHDATGARGTKGLQKAVAIAECFATDIRSIEKTLGHLTDGRVGIHDKNRSNTARRSRSIELPQLAGTLGDVNPWAS